jgi:hypothetical protein
MRIPYLGLLALGGTQNPDHHVIELEKQVIEQLEKELDQNTNHNAPCPDGNFRCRDGTCIDGKAHCDGISDCPDESDESADCNSKKRLHHSSNSESSDNENQQNNNQHRVRRQDDFFFATWF